MKAKKEATEYLDDGKSDEHKDKGNEFFKAGDFPNALKEFEEALKRNPTNIAVYSNRSATYAKLLDPVRALSDADYCVKLDDKFLKGWVRKAQAHHLSKEYHKALDAWQKALAMEPESAECKAGYAKTMQTIQTTSHASSGNDQERMEHAMADPDI